MVAINRLWVDAMVACKVSGAYPSTIESMCCLRRAYHRYFKRLSLTNKTAQTDAIGTLHHIHRGFRNGPVVRQQRLLHTRRTSKPRTTNHRPLLRRLQNQPLNRRKTTSPGAGMGVDENKFAKESNANRRN